MDADHLVPLGGDAPLGDIRVLAVEQYGAGPFATLQLSELGAEVIKIEQPDSGGDIGRYVPPDADGADSLFFQTFNHGKESLLLDLNNPSGRQVFEGLVAESDVVFSNLRGDVPRRLRLCYRDLSDFNPRIVCCSLSAYGMTGPRSGDPGYDYLIQGLAGWMSLTGDPGAPPTKTGLSLVDFSSGYAAAASILAAVHVARRTGRGGDVDLSLYDVAINLLTYLATWHLTLGLAPTRIAASGHPTLVPFQNFEASDGWIVVACAKEVFWSRLVEEVDQDDLRDPRFRDFAGRLEHRELLVERLGRHLRGRSVQEWVRTLGERGIPCGPVQDVPSALLDEQVQDRDLIRRFAHPVHGEVAVVRSPLRLSHDPGTTRLAPALDADREAVLERVLGVGLEEIDGWARAGAFGSAPKEGGTV